MTAEMRERLLAIAGDTKGEFDCVPIQEAVPLRSKRCWARLCPVMARFSF